MKIRRSIICFFVTIIILTMIIVWFKSKPAQIHLSSPLENKMTEQAATQSNEPFIAIVRTNAPTTKAPASAGQTSSQDKGEQIREGLAKLNDVAIVFYGRLEDQFGSPIVGAEIIGSTIIYNGTQSGSENVSAISDADGFFQLKAGKGESMGITPHKNGYVLATANTYFKYSYMYPDHFTPDQNHPTVIKMWKLKGAEPLIDISKEYKLPFTDKPVYFDLIAKKVVSNGGDLKITVNRPEGIISQQHPQNWSIHLEIFDGGFIETSGKESSITFAAPENGYQPNGIFGNNNGPDAVDKTFFVQSRNGQVFSKFHLLFGINNTPGGSMDVIFSGVANTNSSRNWEATAQQ